MNLLNNKYFKRILVSFSLLASSTTFANHLEGIHNHVEIIDFSDLSLDEIVTSQYESQGLIISGIENDSEVPVFASDFSSSGRVDTRSLSNCTDNGWPTGCSNRADILRLTFTSEVDNLSFNLDTQGGEYITFEVYNSENILIETLTAGGEFGDSPAPLVIFSSSNISRIDGFQPYDGWVWALDNLTFTTSDNPVEPQITPIEFSFSHHAPGFEAVGIGCDISLDITSTSALLESPVSVPELMPSTQHVYVSSSTKSEDGTQETIVISYNADDATTTGLGLRIHFDSSVLSASDISTLVSTDLLVNGVVESDNGDLDSDASTDQYIAFTWASLFGAWPGSVPAELVSITFDFVDVATGSTPINLTASSNAAWFGFDGQNHIINLDTSATSEDNCGTPGDLSNQQAVYVASSTIVGSQKYVTIGYSSDDSTTTGLGLRVHYESDKLSLNTVIDILQTDLIFMTDQNEDTDNYDENAVTDKYVEMSWANLFGAWPQTNSINLVTLVFDINEYEPPTQPQQIISVNNTPKAVLGRTTVLEVAYNTTDNNNQLSGLGMRVHFDSSLLSVKEVTGLLEQDIIVSGEGPFSDDANFDNDPLTDQYMLFGWASLYNNWPDTNLPTILMNITFDVSQNIDTEAISSTNINFSNSSFTVGYEFTSESYELEILNATWDFDGNGQADALTDGLMMIRYLFGLRDDFVTDGAMAENSPFTSEQIVAEIEEAMDIADIDADGELNALTDGLLLLRYLFDLRDDLLTNGVVGLDGIRTSNEDIQSYLGAHMPPI